MDEDQNAFCIRNEEGLVVAVCDWRVSTVIGVRCQYVFEKSFHAVMIDNNDGSQKPFCQKKYKAYVGCISEVWGRIPPLVLPYITHRLSKVFIVTLCRRGKR